MPRATYINKTSSGVVCAGECWVDGFYVNSTSSGSIKIYDSTTNSGDVILSPLVPAAGSHNLFGVHATNAIYVEGIAGTWDITFLVRETD